MSSDALRLLHPQHAHAATPSRSATSAAMRWRWSAGVPASARFDDEAAQVQVQVVLERDPDAPVHLHAVLQQLGAVLADVGLGRADQLGRIVAALLGGGAGPALMACDASSQLIMSANRCFRAW